MSSTTNPLLTNLLPGGNPTGNTLSVPYGSSGGSTVSGSNPLMPAVPSGATSPAMPYSTTTFAANSSPYTSATGPAVPSATSTTGGNTFGQGTTVGNTIAGSPALQTSLNTTLGKNYGTGLASTIENFLGSGAGFNQQAINQVLAGLAPQDAQNLQDLLTSFSSTGNRFSSGAQIGTADLMSQENLNAGEIESSMYEQSVNDYLSTLMGIAGTSSQRIQTEPSTWDQVSSALGLAGSTASGVQSDLSGATGDFSGSAGSSALAALALL